MHHERCDNRGAYRTGAMAQNKENRSLPGWRGQSGECCGEQAALRLALKSWIGVFKKEFQGGEKIFQTMEKAFPLVRD